MQEDLTELSHIDIARLPHSLDEAIEAAERGDTVYALIYLEKAARSKNIPRARSYYGYCLAKERRAVKKAIDLCRRAVEDNPRDPALYLNLGRVLLMGGLKDQAITTFRRGLKFGRDTKIILNLKKLGLRKPPVFPQLSRNHYMNRLSGKLLTRMGLR